MNLTPYLLALAIGCLACVSESETDGFVRSGSKADISFLSLGDSYTIGESVADSARWSVQLAQMLRQEGYDVGVPDIIAKTGWTTAELADAIKASKNDKRYDLVSLLIGVNNQYRGQSVERFRTEFRDLLATSVRYAGGRKDRVFVLSIPDWGVSPFGASRDRAQIAREIDAFNAVAKEETQKAGIMYVDITPISRRALGNADMFASDGLHFSGEMYSLWAREALPAVRMLLSK
jgi:lysophospholipase L1-like esterase